MRTPAYASCAREICVQIFGNAYQQNKENNGAFQRHLYHHQTIQRIEYWNVVRKRCALSFHNTRVPSVIICVKCSQRRVETESRFLRTLYASLPWFCVQLGFFWHILGNSVLPALLGMWLTRRLLTTPWSPYQPNTDHSITSKGEIPTTVLLRIFPFPLTSYHHTNHITDQFRQYAITKCFCSVRCTFYRLQL